MNITREQYEADIHKAKAQALREEADKLENEATLTDDPVRARHVSSLIPHVRARADELESMTDPNAHYATPEEVCKGMVVSDQCTGWAQELTEARRSTGNS